MPTTNILSRVTGGNPSNIFGTIQTTGFGSANLFLMNPAGIVFGPSASLNVGGSASFTTADYLRFADGAQFHAIPGPQDASISSAPVAAFGFLGSNPAAITVQGGQLAVAEGQALSLVGGNITIEGATLAPETVQPAQLFAPGGRINLASVASSGEVLFSSLQSAPNVNGESFTQMGNISLTGGSTVDVSADGAGTVTIRGGQFVIAEGTISADTVNSNGAPTAIDVAVTGNLSLANDLAPAITARTSGEGNAGAITLTSGGMEAITSALEDGVVVALIDSHTSGPGRGGDITIVTGDLHATNQNFFIDSGSAGPGHGGDVTISGKNILIEGPDIGTGDFLSGLFGAEVTGSAGNLSITADSLKLDRATLSTEAFLARAGNLTLKSSGDVHITGPSFVAADGDGSGAVSVTADRFAIDAVSFLTNHARGDQPGDNTTITARVVEMSTGGLVQTGTFGEGRAGNLIVSASERITISGSNPDFGQSSGLASNSFGDFGGSGASGSIILNTPRLEIVDGGQLNTVTRTSGRGGDVSITGADSVLISGERPFEDFGIVGLGSTRASGIYTRTIGNEFCVGPCGDAGNVTISTGSTILSGGGTVNSGTLNSGRGGTITINATDQISLSGTLLDGTPGGIFSRTVGAEPGSGEGGNIALTAGQSVNLAGGSTVSASSIGPANAGNITINAGSQFLSQNASVTTEASQASGGNIVVQATDSIRLVNSTISTSVQGGPETSGGNITIDPTIMTLQNSQILAQAVQGQGGNITIVAGTFLMDATSLVSASSQFGLSGTVNIQSPVSMLSGTLATLPKQPLPVQHLLQQRCAAQANGQLSSLVVAGRDTLPSEPGGWLMSSMALLSEDVPVAPPHPLPSDALLPSPQTMIVSGQLYERRPPSQQGITNWAAGCGS